MLSYQGRHWREIGQLCLGLLPRILSMSIPIGFILALLWVYNRLIHDNERDVMSACGASPWFFAYPGVLLSVALTLILYGINLDLTPRTTAMAKKKEYLLRQSLDPSFLTPGVFFQVEGRILYVHRQKENTLFEGLFLYDGRSQEKEIIITGKSAHIVSHGKGLTILLRDATFQEIFPCKAPSILHFKKYTLQFDPSNIPHYKRHVHERSLQELFLPSPKEVRTYRKELSYRLFFPLFPIVDALWTTLILLYYSGRRMPSFLAVVLLGSLYMASIMTQYGPFLLTMSLSMGGVLWVASLYQKRG